MLAYWWTIDVFVLLFFHTLISFVTSWWWSKDLTIRPWPSPQKKKTRIKMLATARWRSRPIVFSYSYLYIYYILFIHILYWYNWAINNTKFQLQLTNINWFYLINLSFVIIIVWKIYTAWIKYMSVSAESLGATIILFFTLFFYLVINNLFFLVLLLEIQGVIFLYFLSQNQVTLKWKNNKSSTISILQQLKMWQSNTLFLQFWTNFFGALLLILSTIQLCDTYGLLNLYDLAVVLQIHFYLHVKSSFKICLALVLLTLGLMLKAGLFPFHFWKPELYRHLSYLTLFIYATIYVFAFIYLLTFIVHTGILHANSLILLFIWFVVILSVYILVGIIFYITEIKLFLAYMSTAHLTYIFALLLVSWPPFDKFLFYLFIYMFISINLFLVLLSFKQLPLKYLSDIQFLNCLPHVLSQLILVVVAMAGLPPFAGFWVKIYIVINLWANAEYILALHILMCGLILMYFYFYSYKYTSVINTKIASAKLQIFDNPFILHASILFTILNIFSVTFINDILIWAFISIMQF